MAHLLERHALSLKTLRVGKSSFLWMTDSLLKSPHLDSSWLRLLAIGFCLSCPLCILKPLKAWCFLLKKKINSVCEEP